jgi:hypothetical protein
MNTSSYMGGIREARLGTALTNELGCCSLPDRRLLQALRAVTGQVVVWPGKLFHLGRTSEPVFYSRARPLRLCHRFDLLR